MESSGRTYSIVVPIYNAEKYLAECIDAILGQTYPKLELILIDDGSTDGSGAMCDAYAQRDARVRVLHTENRGELLAATTGVLEARGDYILSSDADDVCDQRLLETVDAQLRRCDADVVLYGMETFGGKRDVQTRFPFPAGKLLSREEVMRCVIADTNHSQWNKALRTAPAQAAVREAWDDFQRVARASINLDYVRVVLMLCKMQTAVAIPDLLYRYRILAGSASHACNPRHVPDLARTTAYVLEILRENGFGSEEWERLCYTAFLRTSASRMLRMFISGLSAAQEQEAIRAIHAAPFYQASAAYERREDFSPREYRVLRAFRKGRYGMVRLEGLLWKNAIRVRDLLCGR